MVEIFGNFSADQTQSCVPPVDYQLLLPGVAHSMRNVRVTNELSVSNAVAGKCEYLTRRAKPKGRTFPSLLTSHSNTTVPLLSMITILNGGLHLRGSLGLMKRIISPARPPAKF